jgi:hypothetical protein
MALSSRTVRGVKVAMLLAPLFWGAVWWLNRPAPRRPRAVIIQPAETGRPPSVDVSTCWKRQRLMQQSLADCPQRVMRRVTGPRLGPGDFPMRRAPLGS